MSEFQDWLDTQVIEDQAAQALEENGLDPSTKNLKKVWLKELDLLWEHLNSAAERVAEESQHG